MKKHVQVLEKVSGKGSRKCASKLGATFMFWHALIAWLHEDPSTIIYISIVAFSNSAEGKPFDVSSNQCVRKKKRSERAYSTSYHYLLILWRTTDSYFGHHRLVHVDQPRNWHDQLFWQSHPIAGQTCIDHSRWKRTCISSVHTNSSELRCCGLRRPRL